VRAGLSTYYNLGQFSNFKLTIKNGKLRARRIHLVRRLAKVAIKNEGDPEQEISDPR
jgi:hypothetical protein